MKISAKTITASQATTFLAQHRHQTPGYLIGKGTALLGYNGESSVEDFLNILANPGFANRELVHVKIAAQVNGDVATATQEIAADALEIEKSYVHGFAVRDDMLRSIPAGMIAGLILHEQTAMGSKRPHGHLLVFPVVLIQDTDDKIFFHQLDNRRLIVGVRGCYCG